MIVWVKIITYFTDDGVGWLALLVYLKSSFYCVLIFSDDYFLGLLVFVTFSTVKFWNQNNLHTGNQCETVLVLFHRVSEDSGGDILSFCSLHKPTAGNLRSLLRSRTRLILFLKYNYITEFSVWPLDQKIF